MHIFQQSSSVFNYRMRVTVELNGELRWRRLSFQSRGVGERNVNRLREQYTKQSVSSFAAHKAGLTGNATARGLL